ncbi:MAG: CHAT domain-containing protein [Anaerolineales bacterium]|nr:CHAT domain-containing protein [Anaerolineales bacterium]
MEQFFVQIGHSRLIESSQAQKMREFGQLLFEATFSGDVRDRLRESLNEVTRKGEGLRIRLRTGDIPELTNLPWEFMYDASLGRFLALSIDTPLVRYLDTPRDIQPLAIRPPLRILAMISSPRDFPTLNVQKEWENLQESLSRLESRGLVALTRLEKPTLQMLQRQLRREHYHIFHFVGHGVFSKQYQDGFLLFEDELREGHRVSSRDLGILLHDHPYLRLAVLNACEGARISLEDQFSGTAQNLMQQGLPAVIAMQFRITDIAAITLAREFYAALADGYPVDAALTEARKAIKTHGNDLEWGTPVLYMRAPNGQIFDVESIQSTPKSTKAETITDAATETKLATLYTEGLEAFYLQEWENAVTKFKSILSITGSYKDTASKLELAQHRLKINTLDKKAQAAEANGNWEVATKSLETLVKEFPEQNSFVSRLENARKQLRLRNLYAEVQQLAKAEKWLAVIQAFREIHSLDANYPDPDNLFSVAEEASATLKMQSELESLYQNALQAIDTSEWTKAQTILNQIQSKKTGYRETERLLQRANEEIERTERQRQEEDKVSSLYIQAENLLHRKQWQKSLEKVEEIFRLFPGFDDPKHIASQARSELEKAKKESEKQDRLAELYAEAVKANQAGEYQQALEKWKQIRALDENYPDRQRVQASASRMLKKLSKPEGFARRPRATEIDTGRTGSLDIEITKQTLKAFVIFSLARAILELIFKVAGLSSLIDQSMGGHSANIIYLASFGFLTGTALWWTFSNGFIPKIWKSWGSITLTSTIAIVGMFFGAILLFSRGAGNWVWILAWAIIGPITGLILAWNIRQGTATSNQKLFWQLPIIWLIAFILGQQIASEFNSFLSSRDFDWHNMISLALESGIAGLIGSTFTLIQFQPDQTQRKKLNYFATGILLVTSIAIILLTGGQQIQRNLAIKGFAGAIGEWRAKDPSDLSNLSLSIQRSLFTGEYTVTYFDDSFKHCHNGPAGGTLVKKIAESGLNASISLRCENHMLTVFQTFYFIYDPNKDSLVNKLNESIRWERK